MNAIQINENKISLFPYIHSWNNVICGRDTQNTRTLYFSYFLDFTFTIFLFQRRVLFTWSKICFYFSISLMLDHALLDVLTNSCNLVLSMKMLSLEKSFHLLHLKNNNQKAIQTSDSIVPTNENIYCTSSGWNEECIKGIS